MYRQTTIQRVMTKLYSYKKKRNYEEIPEMKFYYIESPKGTFHYPLFKTENEAEYFDEITNKVDIGKSHSHMYAEDPTGTEWFMPEENHNVNKHTYDKAPSKDLTFNGKPIEYTMIPVV